MAGTDTRPHRTPSTERNTDTVRPDEELAKTLERDTAVQGESGEDAAAAARSPAGTDSAPPAAKPGTGARHTPK